MSKRRKLNQILLTMAGQLPDRLVADIYTEHGAFCIRFLHSLSKEDFVSLNKEAEKKNKDFVLFFFWQKQGSTKLPEEIKNFQAFDFSKVIQVRFNGSTADYANRIDDTPIPYVSVTLVTK